MEVVVVGELCGVQEVLPVILSVVAEHTEVRFEPFVIALDLSLGLGMICSGQALVNAKASVEGPHVWVIELQSSVRVMM